MGIYVEIFIHSAMDELWQKTQVPHVHQRWDLRFTDIEYLPRVSETEPQRFLYATRIGFGLNISGEGESVATREDAEGRRTSSLKFWSEDGKSLITEGSGYWKYIPTDDGIRFLTWYDYRTRFGILGRVFDTAVFRPLLGWATAWSFDRLRLWLEQGIDPDISLQRTLIYGIARVTIAFIWLYQGLIPKLLFQHHDELTMLVQSGVSPASAPSIVAAFGVVEVLLGLAFLLLWRNRWLLWLNVGLMIVATAGVIANAPQYLTAAFNPITLNVAMMMFSLIGLVSGRNLPSAQQCRRSQPEHET